MSPPAHRQRLAGARVLVPRPRERAEPLCLSYLGAEPGSPGVDPLATGEAFSGGNPGDR